MQLKNKTNVGPDVLPALIILCYWQCCKLTRVIVFFVYISLSAATIVEAGKDKTTPDDFAQALDSVLGDFAFPDVFLFDVWGVIGDVRNGGI